MLDYERDRLAWLVRTRDEFGDMVRLAPGVIVIHNPDLIHEVLAGTNEKFLLDSALIAGRRSRRALIANIPQWMQIRRHTWHSLDRRMVNAHLERLRVALTEGVRASAGVNVDVFAFAQRLCGAAVADFCLGAEGSVDDVVDAAEELFWTSARLTGRAEPRVRWLPRPAARAASAANRKLLALLHRRVTDRGSTPEATRDLLDVLLRNPQPLSADLLAEVLRITLVASHGVPGAALVWSLVRLAAHPQQAKLVADDPVHTAAFVKEVLRLHPPTWLLSRRTVEAMDFGGYHLDAGEEILFSPYLLHRDPRWWQEPEEFLPQRWLGTQPAHPPRAYLPFGSGTRVCPGGHMGSVQLELLVTEFACHYSLDLPGLDQITLNNESILRPAALRGSWSPLL